MLFKITFEHVTLLVLCQSIPSIVCQLTLKVPRNYHMIPVLFCRDRFWTHRDFGEDIEKQGKHGEVDTDPLSTKAFLQVLWHGHDLQIKENKVS